MRRNVVAGALVVAAICGCARRPAPPAPTPAEVTVSRPVTQEVAEELEFTGTTAPLESVDVRARVTGFLEEVHFQPRAKVKRGDLLFTIDQRPFKNALDNFVGAEAALQAQLIKAQSDLEKMQRLWPQGAASQDELTEALSTRDTLNGQIAQAQAQIHSAQLDLDFCKVTAPTDGRISRNLIDPGNIVTADHTVLATIVNDDAIYAYFNASERDVLVIREQTRQQLEAADKTFRQQPELSEVRPPAFIGLMTEDGFPHAGFIDYAAPELDASTGTIQLRARFDNTDGVLLPGLFVRVRVPVGQPHAALTVTERALGSDQGQRYLLVVNDKNVVEYRPVKVGTLHDGARVILAGLKPDDWVIVNGIQRVRPGVTVKPIQAPMPISPAATLLPPTTGQAAPASESSAGAAPPPTAPARVTPESPAPASSAPPNRSEDRP
jgi:RND family efflux transporter MFP subunit